MKSLLVILILTIISLSSCKKDNKAYNGAALIEFTKAEIVTTIPFSQSIDYSIPIKIQLISSRLHLNQTIKIEEVDTNTAIKGIHYSINSYSTILYADSLFAIFTLNIKANSIKDNETVNVTFKISDSSDIKPSKNFQTCKITLKKQSFINLFVGQDSCFEPINQGKYITSFTSGTIQNTILEQNFWDFPSMGQTLTYTLERDSLKTVTIYEQLWVDKIGNQYKISGSGNYDLKGGMIVNYIINNASDNSLYEKGIHRFIHLN